MSGWRYFPVATAIAATIVLTTPAMGQTDVAERYRRASRLQYLSAITAVKNNAIVPHWIDGEDRFWYRRETETGSAFVVVDAATGQSGPAFDATVIAQGLAAVTKQAASADALPFTTFDYAQGGRAIAFQVGASKYECTLATPACRATGAVAAPDLLISPDGTSALFVRGGNLFIRTIATGAERALTDDGTLDKGWAVQVEPSDFHAIGRQASGSGAPPLWTAWSPDSKRLITSFVDQSAVKPYPYIDYAPSDGSVRPRLREVRLALVGDQPAVIQLYAIDVASGKRQRIDLDNSRFNRTQRGAHHGEWAPDGRHYLLFTRSADLGSAVLFDIDAVTGTVREAIREKGVYPALLNAGGSGAANVALLKGGTQAIWSSQRDGWPHLYLYDVATGRELRRLTRGKWVVRDILRVDEKLGKLFFVASGREGGNPYYRSVYSVDLDGRRLRRLTPEADDTPIANPATTLSFDGASSYDPVSPSGRYIVYGTAPLSAPATTLLRRTDGAGRPVVLEHGDARALFAAGFRAPEAFTAKAADGSSDLYGVIYRPGDYEAGRKYPVILAQYNSPIVPIAPRNFGIAYSLVTDNASPAAEAQLGFIVVMVDPRGTPYRGAAFSDPAAGYIATMGLDDQVAALRQLAVRDRSMDMDHVGIVGASFGGWTAIRALILHNDLFKAAVAWAPPGSFHTMYQAPELTIPSGVPHYAGGASLRPTDKAVPENWAQMDSVAQAGLMKGRLLLGSGALDENVLPGSTMQFLDAAAKADKDVETMFLPGATHGPLPYWPYVVKRTWDFLVRNLRGETPPNDFVFPPGTFPPSK